MTSNTITHRGGKWIVSRKYLFLLLLAAPFLILSFFNHPSSDDFLNADAVRTLGFVDSQVHLYNFWQGRFFANFIASLIAYFIHPVDVFFMANKILPLASFLLLFFSFWFFIWNATAKLLGGQEAFNLAIILFLLSLNYSNSQYQSFYHFAGIISYMLAYKLLLIFAGILFALKEFDTFTRPRKILLFTTTLILIVAITGSYEYYMAILFLILCSAAFIYRKNVMFVTFLIVFLIIGRCAWYPHLLLPSPLATQNIQLRVF